MEAPPAAVERARVRSALAEAAGFGMYFTAPRDTAGVSLSAEQFCAPDRLRAVVDAVGRQIGSSEARVAISTLQFGLAARYWSLALGVWRCGGVILDLAGLRYTVTGAGSVSVTLDEPRGRDATTLSAGDVAESLIGAVLSGQLTGLHAALRTVAPVADGLLWGNAASALYTAARTVAAGRPDARLDAVASAMLTREPLAGHVVRGGDGAALRRSCCLFYRTTHSFCCGDCPLTGRAVTR
ncbi:hypothetical protein E4P42_19405 [Mycobacterium sp. PS03-16]|uniref:hypothetical protein n=1 Tax=Mycobacterium sp. PS03-16 TaxID=2559611 RepID=UPI001073BD67|nr:hypothetical protein [Mycobacterium sp. PS03-16]TFV56402.1 hypothetical protein E4P42_19405 [Mycobacterium sp. PS03-16]